ncbi:glycosyltransferase family 4 protein [Muricoccus radiodurans]|uniref:glycosyltransferase family 4 protein n=1 Tax=Muricoccus radiodurans TaxID=2231721 RepID=UPI003CF1F092
MILRQHLSEDLPVQRTRQPVLSTFGWRRGRPVRSAFPLVSERPSAQPHVVLDISRLLNVAGRTAPSGIDRVEMAYARRWAARPEGSCTFVAQGVAGPYAALPWRAATLLITGLTEAWNGADPHGRAAGRVRRLARQLRWRVTAGFGQRALSRVLREPGPKVFLLVSHRALERERPIAAIRDAGCAFVPLIHDLIPATHPEYARPGQAQRHLRRIATTAALADAVIVNSAHTAEALAPYLAARPKERGAPPPVLVAPLGVETPSAPAPALPTEPYFVVLGTIEPRKNHLLLLHLWRDLVSRLGTSATPRLLVIGRRGWENENIVDILDRNETLRGVVREIGHLPDRQLWELLRGARALLFPSFAEGYGLPLAEALAMGVPALCSDLPALREVGGEVPEYLDPLDGPAWRDVILGYAEPESAGRAAQLARLSGWRTPRWEGHFEQVDAMLSGLVPMAPWPVPGTSTDSGPVLRGALQEGEALT